MFISITVYALQELFQNRLGSTFTLWLLPALAMGCTLCTSQGKAAKHNKCGYTEGHHVLTCRVRDWSDVGRRSTSNARKLAKLSDTSRCLR